MNDRLTRIRENEKISHTAAYTNEKLYDKTSWLQKPIKTVLDILPLFHAYTELHVLDLGCGIGRNSICIAETYQNINCTIDCVDLLEIALEKLKQNAKEYGVSENISEILKPIEEYEIRSNFYDLIMAVSALEHIDSEKSFVRKLTEIRNGVRENGIVCLVINSNVRETNAATKEIMEPQFEVNLPTERLQLLLEDTFSGWRVLKTSVTAQEYDIPRDKIISHLDTNVVTYVAQRDAHKNPISNK
ncbi:MAG: class I SAM-dependent methyltransferase [Lachnospiraceae bacterium]|nr:class I SAM-dependent methyltransferase [Lachnospiraceae bacterium]